MSGAAIAMRACLTAAGGLAVLVLLVACGQLPSPRIMEDAPALGRVAELLKAPPLRDVPGSVGELRPPYPCGKNLYMSMHFASQAGVVYFAGTERYAVLDIGTGDTVATGAGQSLGLISANGRVLMVPGEDGLELRNTETGEVLAFLPGATGDEFDWVGDTGILYIAPARPFQKPRIVHRDLATGLESSLAFVDPRPSRYIFDFFLFPEADGKDVHLLARSRFHALNLLPGPDGTRAQLGASQPADFLRPHEPKMFTGTHFVVFQDEAASYIRLEAGTESPVESRVDLPGFFPKFGTRTADPDRHLIRGHFVDEAGQPLQQDGEVVWRDFYYSASRRTLAPVSLPVDVSRITYIPSTRSHVLRGDASLTPFVLPDGGEEGEPAGVLAAALAEVIASLEGAR